MCAAPGSKTSQMLEAVADGCDGINPNGEGGGEPRGYVVANDSDPKRAYMLVHQLRRLNSPCQFVSACDAQFFPALDSNRSGKGGAPRAEGEEGTFDRVLCDVPCSGDGTLRKNPGVWKHWSQMGGPVSESPSIADSPQRR